MWWKESRGEKREVERGNREEEDGERGKRGVRENYCHKAGLLNGAMESNHFVRSYRLNKVGARSQLKFIPTC